MQQARVLQESAGTSPPKRWHHFQSTLPRGRWAWCHGALLGHAAAAPPMRAIAPGSSTTLARWLSRRWEGEPERFTTTVAALFLKPVAFSTPSHQVYGSISMSTWAHPRAPPGWRLVFCPGVLPAQRLAVHHAPDMPSLRAQGGAEALRRFERSQRAWGWRARLALVVVV